MRHIITGGDTTKYAGSTVYPHRLQVIGAENGLPGYGILVTSGKAATYGRAGVIDNHGGTAADVRAERERGLLIYADAGDVLVLDGLAFTLTLDRRGYPVLTPTE